MYMCVCPNMLGRQSNDLEKHVWQFVYGKFGATFLDKPQYEATGIKMATVILCTL
jgi:hypothetical protein